MKQPNNPFNPPIAGQIPISDTPVQNSTPMPGGGAAMSFEVDLTDVTNGFVIPDGMYPMKCIDAEQGISASGNPQIVWTFAISDNSSLSGREFKLWTAITAAAMWKVAEVVTALGIGAVGQRVKFSRSDVVGKMCNAQIEETTYKGNTRSSITQIFPM